ncbi:MAG: hypothetical protein RLZ12_377 [Bacillota bacterium]|jgi:hypothetical protein
MYNYNGTMVPHISWYDPVFYNSCYNPGLHKPVMSQKPPLIGGTVKPGQNECRTSGSTGYITCGPSAALPPYINPAKCPADSFGYRSCRPWEAKWEAGQGPAT